MKEDITLKQRNINGFNKFNSYDLKLMAQAYGSDAPNIKPMGVKLEQYVDYYPWDFSDVGSSIEIEKELEEVSHEKERKMRE